jgi:hypothetical protein
VDFADIVNQSEQSPLYIHFGFGGDCFKIGKLHMKRQGDRNPEIKCDQVTRVAKFNPSAR